MKCNNQSLYFWVLVVGLAGFLLTYGDSTVYAKRKTKTPTAEEAALNRAELQAAVVSFANRYMSVIGQAAVDFEAALPTPEGRLMAARRKVYSLSSMAEIAAGANPGGALLDVVIVTKLNRLVWQKHWRPKVFGKPADIMIKAFKIMENEAWETSAKVLTMDQVKALNELILEWHRKHPHQTAVDYIRLSDFGDLGRKPALYKMKVKGGLLAPVKQAVQAVDEVRITAERALFMISKMQVLMGFQAELVYKTLVGQPEIRRILQDLSGFQATGDRFADLFEKLPRQLADERQAALKEVAALIARERKAILATADRFAKIMADLPGQISRETEVTLSRASLLIARERDATLTALNQNEPMIQQLLQEIRGTLGQMNSAFGSLQETATGVGDLLTKTDKGANSLKSLIDAVDKLAGRFESAEPQKETKPFDINEYTQALLNLQEAAKGLNELITGINQTLQSPAIAGIVTGINRSAEERIDHLFIRLIQLLGILAGLVILILIIYFAMKRRATIRTRREEG